MTAPYFATGCAHCHWLIGHATGCPVGEAEATEQKKRDCRLGTELLEAIDNRDTVRIGRILRGEA